MGRAYGPMNPELKAQWVEALRSGKYRKNTCALVAKKQKKFSYCALGVLCQIDPQTTRIKDPGLFQDLNFAYAFQDERGNYRATELPFETAFRAQLTSPVQNEIIQMNDAQQKSFREIADWIEENL